VGQLTGPGARVAATSRPAAPAVNGPTPMPADPDDFLTPVVGRQLVRCDRCRRTDEVTHADLMRYLVKGWPACCGEVMSYFVEARRPTLPDPAAGARPRRRR